MVSNIIPKLNTYWMKSETVGLILSTWALSTVQCSKISKKKVIKIYGKYSLHDCERISRGIPSSQIDLSKHFAVARLCGICVYCIQHKLQFTTAHHKSLWTFVFFFFSFLAFGFLLVLAYFHRPVLNASESRMNAHTRQFYYLQKS